MNRKAEPLPAQPVLVSQHNSLAVAGLPRERFLEETRTNPRLTGKVYRRGKLRLVALSDLLAALQSDRVTSPEEREEQSAKAVLRAIGPRGLS